MESAIAEYFNQANLNDPTALFDWEYILIENDKVKNIEENKDKELSKEKNIYSREQERIFIKKEEIYRRK